MIQKWELSSLGEDARKSRRTFKPQEGGTSLEVQWPRLCAPSAGGLGSLPGPGTRSHLPQLRVPPATTKTWHSQINKCFFKKTKKENNEKGSVGMGGNVRACRAQWRISRLQSVGQERSCLIICLCLDDIKQYR